MGGRASEWDAKKCVCVCSRDRMATRVCKELFSFIIYYPVCTSNFRETMTMARTTTATTMVMASRSLYSMHIIHSIMANWDYACCHFTLYFLPLVIWDAHTKSFVCLGYDMNAFFVFWLLCVCVCRCEREFSGVQCIENNKTHKTVAM